ncbi:MAG: bifunctional indole-3-glycerol phosphate synthase/phosphoribosylanthranilate isomerase [Spirochaetales bacterium]|jgi:indole-3-glycerol phosphate synthase/phosphoribosylanthranilate isomerase|nr:bifunctional indole-3-glycerol phosphate synthase/phosphoribosylanthranilate isomerase [Spirochaetales bacterium]
MRLQGDIRMEILNNRKRRIAAEGFGLSTKVPNSRTGLVVPVEELLIDPLVICEVKRVSPSKGDIDLNIDPVKLAGIYQQKGAAAVSVLTEEDYFKGSLDDLIRIKQSCPDLAVLRKDFLFCRRDIDVSYRAGADMVLLIASLLSEHELEDLYHLTLSYGMLPLVEVHDAEDIRKARIVTPILTGINSRDLKNFTVDSLFPIIQSHLIDWPTALVFESGIRDFYDAEFAGKHGFRALLAGESVVHNPDVIPDLITGLDIGTDNYKQMQKRRIPGDFWTRLTAGKKVNRPLVKICGITNREDAELAEGLGADCIGFVLAKSPRKAQLSLIEELQDLEILKCAVVVDVDQDGELKQQLEDLLRRGVLDVVQFHGDEPPQFCREFSFPWFKALRIRRAEQIAEVSQYRSPRVLIDAFSPAGYGGTGKQIRPDLIKSAGNDLPLWLAGGLNPENIRDMLLEYQPELVDVSSGLELAPGRKDPQKMRNFFKEIERSAL